MPWLLCAKDASDRAGYLGSKWGPSSSRLAIRGDDDRWQLEVGNLALFVTVSRVLELAVVATALGLQQTGQFILLRLE